MEKKEFNKTEYDIDYRKKHKKQFNADLNIDEMEELEELLKKKNLTKIQFLRNAIKDLKKENK